MATTMLILGESVQSSAKLVSAAKAQGFLTTIVAVGSADEWLLSGSDKIIVLKGASDRVEAYSGAIADLVSACDTPCVLAAPSTVVGREVAAYVAGILECGMASDVASFEALDTMLRVSRTVFGGAVIQTIDIALPCVVTVGVDIASAEMLSATPAVEMLEVEADLRVKRISFETESTKAVNLSEASSVVCVGMGIDGTDDLAMAEELAGLLGGAVGCTRNVAEGMKLLPKERYIGITGVVVKPDLYLSMGVSGQLQHVYGIRDSKIIAAIDSNKDARIFNAADYGIIGDLHEVVPQIIAALRA